MNHQPVLLEKVLECVPADARRIIDATLGSGGHARSMLKKAPRAELLGIDLDEAMARQAKENLSIFSDRVNIVVGNFREIKEAANDIGWNWADFILFDLGVSSLQLDDPQRGMSFQALGPLDMRFDRHRELTAAKIVNFWSEHDLARLFHELGEEPFARRIASAIVKARRLRPLATTGDLVDVVASVLPAKVRIRRPPHFATNVFRALRMAVNDELGSLKEALPKAVTLLAPGGKILVISFHSLEDRIVKQAFRANPALKVVTKKPITPEKAEITANPRARSAKLRIGRKLTAGYSFWTGPESNSQSMDSRRETKK